MNKVTKIAISSFLVVASGLFSTASFASEGMAKKESRMQKQKKEDLRSPAEFQQVVEDYKAYASKVSPEIRDEVIGFRKEISKLNGQKRQLYRKLSQDAQKYLKKEQAYKKKLPLNRRKLIDARKIAPTINGSDSAAQ